MVSMHHYTTGFWAVRQVHHFDVGWRQGDPTQYLQDMRDHEPGKVSELPVAVSQPGHHHEGGHDAVRHGIQC